ncbi:thermonuclease family protein [Nitrosomonas sp.]|uniref:thermonuclease family protein n=1 Tax=Nitrosomonas sp. TaxID=42353 RepID=UPI00284E1A97|nr:thermonuclease family protein [Nitrosomonas sp.]MDR4513139.1 thermonuclease family protein [Nitrosomonas sp.]
MTNIQRVKFLSSVLTITLGLFAQTVFSTEIFRIEDASGRITYSDKATDGAKQIQLSDRVYRHLHRVKKVYDGDTLILENGKRVRLLGVNTPEIESRHRAGEPGGEQARLWLHNKLQDRKVYLEYDLEKQDKYQRLLAHVFLSDGKHVNLELIKNGLAFLNIMPPNLRHAKQFELAQKQAKQNKLGIWALPRYQARPLSAITSANSGWQRYTGVPQTIQHKKRYTYLNFNDQTNIRIDNEHLNYFPELTSYLGKMVEIRGWVSRRGGKYSIQIRHPSALIRQ